MIRGQKPAPTIGVQLTSAPTPVPTPTPTPLLSPAERMAEARELLRQPYDKSNYEEAIAHLNAVPPDAKEYAEAEQLKQQAIETNRREQAALATEGQLVAVQVRWERSEDGGGIIWRVTLKNNTERPIGDIQYRTTYYSETGDVLNKGVDSSPGKKIAQTVIPPKATRTIEINDGFTHPGTHRAHFQLARWRFVADSK